MKHRPSPKGRCPAVHALVGAPHRAVEERADGSRRPVIGTGAADRLPGRVSVGFESGARQSGTRPCTARIAISRCSGYIHTKAEFAALQINSAGNTRDHVKRNALDVFLTRCLLRCPSAIEVHFRRPARTGRASLQTRPCPRPFAQDDHRSLRPVHACTRKSSLRFQVSIRLAQPACHAHDTERAARGLELGSPVLRLPGRELYRS